MNICAVLDKMLCLYVSERGLMPDMISFNSGIWETTDLLEYCRPPDTDKQELLWRYREIPVNHEWSDPVGEIQFHPVQGKPVMYKIDDMRVPEVRQYHFI